MRAAAAATSSEQNAFLCQTFLNARGIAAVNAMCSAMLSTKLSAIASPPPPSLSCRHLFQHTRHQLGELRAAALLRVHTSGKVDESIPLDAQAYSAADLVCDGLGNPRHFSA